MILRSVLGKIRRQLLCSVHSRPVDLGNQGPAVSFCFDDFPRTAYTVGSSILKSFGARGTYYTAMGLMDKQNDLGDQFRLQDLDSVLADGHELGCHTFSHISCRNVPPQLFEDDVKKGRDALREVTGRDPANFAYPYGHVTLTAKKTVGARMRSCRGIHSGLNAPTMDLNLLRANSLYGDLDQAAELEALLLANEQQKGWLIFYTHDIRPNPSPFGCTPALLEKIVSLAATRGSRIVPVDEVMTSVLGKTPFTVTA